MESGGEAMDDHCPRWVPVKKKHRSGSKFSVQSWAGGFSGKNGSCYQLPMSSVGEKFSNLAGKDRSELSKGAKNYAYVPNTDDNVIANFEKPPNLEKTKENGSPPKLVESHVFQNSVVAEDNLEVQQKDGTETVPKIRSGDIDDGHMLVLYPEGMHEGNVKSSDSENSSLVNMNDESGVEVNFQVPVLVHEVDDSGIQELPDISEVSSLSSSDCVSFYTEKSDNGISGEDRNQFKLEPYEENASELSTSLSEKLESPFVLEGNELEKELEVSESQVKLHESDMLPLNFKEDESRIDESLITDEKLVTVVDPQLLLISKGDELRVLPSPDTAEKLGVVVEPQLSEEYELRAEPPIVVKKSEVMVESPLLLTSKEADFIIPELSTTLEKSGTKIEPSSPLVHEENELRVPKSPVTLGEVDLVESHFPSISNKSYLRVAESPIAIEKTDFVAQSEIPLISKDKEFRVSESSITIDKCRTMVEPSMPLNFKENSVSEVNESRISIPQVMVADPELLLKYKGNDLRALQFPSTIEKLGVVVEPQVPQEYESRDESPIVKISENMVESPLHHTSKEADFRVTELIANLEKSRKEIEPSSPLVHEEIESRVPEPLVTIEKANLAVESHFLFVSGENDLRVVGSPVGIGQVDIVAESELPLISKEKEFKVSESPVTIERLGTMVEPSFLPSFKENESRVTKVNESRNSVSPVTVVDPQYLLMSQANELSVLQNQGTVEKLDVVVKPQMPQEYDSRFESRVVQKSENMVESLLPLTSKEVDYRVTEVSATLENSRTDIETSSPLVPEETELRVPESPITIEKANFAVESQFPFVSRENDLRVVESPVDIGKGDIVTEFELPLTSEEKEFRVSEPPVTIERSGTMVELSLPVSFKENESSVYEVNGSINSVSPFTAADTQYLIMHKGNEFRDLRFPGTVDKLGMVVEPQVPREHELKAKSPVAVKKEQIMVEPTLSLTAEEANFKFSELSATLEKSGIDIEPPSPLVLEAVESRVPESHVTMENTDMVFKSHFPFVSRGNDLRVFESPVAIGKADIVTESKLPLISQEKEFKVYESPVKVEKLGTVGESSLSISFKENKSIVSEVNESRIYVSPGMMVDSHSLLMSKGNESRVLQSSCTIEKLDMVIEPYVPEEYELRAKPLTEIKKAEIMVESPLSLTSIEGDFRVVELSATIEKSRTEIEPPSPLVPEENESRFLESPFTVEKADLAFDSHNPLVSRENDLRIVESPVSIRKENIIDAFELPLISEEKEFRVSKPPVTILKSETMVEPSFPLSLEENESRVFNEPITTEKADMMVKSGSPLPSNENVLEDPMSSVTTEKSDLMVESQLPIFSKENYSRASDFPFRVEKLDTLVGSQLPLISEEKKSRASESPVIIQKSYIVIESQLPLTSKENELKFYKSPITMEKLDMFAESHVPLISKDNNSRALEPLRTVELSDIVSGSQFPLMCEENKLSVSKSQVSFAKSDVLFESHIPPISKENEFRTRERPDIIEKSDMVVGSRLSLVSIENESRVSKSHVTVEKLNTETESQLPWISKEKESRMLESEFSIDKSNRVAETELSFTSKENASRDSDLQIIITNQEGKSRVPEAQNSSMVAKVQTSLSLTTKGNESRGAVMPFGKPDVVVEPQVPNIFKENESSDKSEGDAGESKERFGDRLWGFLFENLNKSVDELYLLCGLECDIDQMKEAVLVLEEAAYDFNELTAWVQEFDKVKRSSQSVDSAMSDLRFDHRRPHALSWEVRRMATSSHRVDILPSSLEAFKKIHQERADILTTNTSKNPALGGSSHHHVAAAERQKPVVNSLKESHVGDSVIRVEQSRCLDVKKQNGDDQLNRESASCSKVNFIQNGYDHLKSFSGLDSHQVMHKLDISATLEARKTKRVHKVEKVEANDHPKNHTHPSENDKDRRNSMTFKSMDAWKEKRRWAERIPSPGTNRRKSAERARVLPDRLMSPEKKKRTAIDWKKEAEEKHERARRIRNELENERIQKLQRSSEKLNRVNEWQAAHSIKLQEEMHARRQTSESRHEAYLAQVARRAGDESSKVNEVRLITSLNEENKKIKLRQKLHDSEVRRAEKVQVRKSKQKEGMAREEAVLERRKLIEAEKVQRLADTQRRKEEARVRREEERKALSAVREARIVEQLRKREERVKAQQEETEMLARKLAERLKESEQRRKFHLDQIRERASMDFRDQSSPLPRRPVSRDGQERSSSSTNSGEDSEERDPTLGPRGHALDPGNTMQQDLLKRHIKKIRQRLMAQKYEFIEPLIGCENSSFGYRTALGTARAKLGRWIQELQRLRQARKEGASSIGLTIADMIKFIEGRDPELQASRQAGLLDFIASALPASHTSKPEACRVTVHLLKLLREMVVKQLDIIDEEQKSNNLVSMNQATTDLLSAISETGLVSLPSLFTSVLLQTSNRPFSEQGSYVLPSNFEEVATGVLKVLNNLALVDISFIQRMLAMPDLKMEFFHLMSFLLSHCTSKWRGATDQIGLLLLESLLLIGYFALFHPENQAVLRWGKSPTILHKVCDLPFAFFSDPELMPVLAGTLVAACYGCQQNKSLVQQEMCVDMLLSLIRSCNGKPNATTDNHPPAEDCSESSNHDFKSSPGGYDNPLKSSRNHVVRPRPSRYSLGGRSSVVSASSIRTGKLRRAGKTGEEMGLKPQSLGAPPEASTMLHCRFSTAFINKAEDFFTSADENV
ncbi:unnamed protein product [Linum tenue]|uniref:S phase cyclin A-associated protein in the endoplasmic reticulum N-terminal domain-containing protein n=1 Tax=Linum tenue TaxID=586396 RepID=A0AAV0RV85_9ROSI|nr:unnamed protein product [Linum tenue]